MKLIALLALFLAGASQAQTVISVQACTQPGTPPTAATLIPGAVVPITTPVAVEVTQSPGLSEPLCQLLSATPSTWAVRNSSNGTNWGWTTLSSLKLGTAFPSTTVQLPVTWSAVTAFTNGAAVTIPLTYNIYRGPSTTALVQIGSSTTLGYTDTAVAAGTTYFYAITATCTGCTESAKSVVVSGVPVVQTLTPLAPTGVIAK